MNSFRLRHLEQALELYHKVACPTSVSTSSAGSFLLSADPSRFSPPPLSTASFPADSLPLDLFLRHYFRCHAKSFTSSDKLFISSHLAQLIKWKGLLDFITPPPAAWSSRIRTYFISDRWKLHAQNTRLPPHLRCSFPEPLFARLEAALGTATALHVCYTLNEEAPLFLRVNPNRISRDRLLKFLLNKGIAAEKCAHSAYGLVLPQRQRLSDLPEFQKNYMEIQDEASQLVALKINVQPGQKVLDFCAGSGGKSLAFAPLMENTGRVYLHDVRETLLRHAKKRMRRAGIQNYELIFPSDAYKFRRLRGSLDWVLCDVPCTATGTLRRNPELKWKYTDERPNNRNQRTATPSTLDLFELVALQREIFRTALQYMHPTKGRIVYSTASILDEENVHQVKFLCQQHGLVLSEPPFHALPQSKGMDGFFCAIFEKKPE